MQPLCTLNFPKIRKKLLVAVKNTANSNLECSCILYVIVENYLELAIIV